MKQQLESFIVLIVLAATSIAPAAGTSAGKFLDRPPEWYRSDDAAKIANTILSFQAPEGGWPKNIETATTRPFEGDRSTLHSTYDNAATTQEMQFLARMYVNTKDDRYKQAFLKALNYVLSGQYPNGRWPQDNPPSERYDRHITFNDGAMGRLMFLVRDISRDDLYSFVDQPTRDRCKDAFDRGIDCILKCQVKVDGKLTAWCAQHDEKDFSPRPARAFELVSLSGAESVGLCHLLMSIENPSPQIVQSVDAAVAWFDSVKIPGIKVEDRPTPNTPRGFERYVVKDPSAPPMWARFYEIGTNRPFFCDRDGIKKYDLSEIGIERRPG